MTEHKSNPLPTLSIPTNRLNHDGIGTYRHLPKIRDGKLPPRRKRTREEIENAREE